MKVYLSGGMRTEWRSLVKEKVDAVWNDPTKHGLSFPDRYTVWDLAGIQACDVLFAYLEISNPSGLGMMLEIGYAKGLGKVVIFVDEKDDHYTQIGRQTSDYFCSKLEDGIEMLAALARIVW